MNQGLLKSYLKENVDQLTEDEVNQVLERIGSLVELIEMLENS